MLCRHGTAWNGTGSQGTKTEGIWNCMVGEERNGTVSNELITEWSGFERNGTCFTPNPKALMERETVRYGKKRNEWLEGTAPARRNTEWKEQILAVPSHSSFRAVITVITILKVYLFRQKWKITTPTKT